MTSPLATRSRKMVRAGLATASLSAALLSLASAPSAAAQSLNPENLAPARMAQIEGLCRSVIGLDPGEEHFVACALSLSHSAWKLDRVRRMQGARDDCLAKGLKPGDVGLSQCELSVYHGGRKAAVEAADAPKPAAVKSLFYASAREIRNREQEACAQIGYDPIYGPFSDCVSNLQSALFAADHPMN